jgi:hypothetical protein
MLFCFLNIQARLNLMLYSDYHQSDKEISIEMESFSSQKWGNSQLVVSDDA